MLNSGRNRPFFVPCDLEIWWMTLKNNRAPVLCCFKLCASFHSHRWIHTKVTVRKRSIRVKIGDFLSRVTLKFDRWHWKTIGHLFYATSSFVHYFTSIGEFKLELQSRNAEVGLNWTIFLVVWPWNLTDDHDDVIKWKHFPRNWPFVRGIHRSRWIPHTKASDAELWCFLWFASE